MFTSLALPRVAHTLSIQRVPISQSRFSTLFEFASRNRQSGSILVNACIYPATQGRQLIFRFPLFRDEPQAIVHTQCAPATEHTEHRLPDGPLRAQITFTKKIITTYP